MTVGKAGNFVFLLLLTSLFINLSNSANILSSGEFKESHNYAYNIVRYFIIFPILQRIHKYYTCYSILPDDLEHFDAFGNFMGTEADLNRKNVKCLKLINFTETFKEFAEGLNRKIDRNDRWRDPKGIMKKIENCQFNLYEFHTTATTDDFVYNHEILEKSAQKWEIKYLNFESLEDGPVDRTEMPKTFSILPVLDIPLRRRFAVILETYLIDLAKLFYPYLEGAKITSFEDFLGLILFHLYTNLEDHNLLNGLLTHKIVNDLRSMGTVLKLPDKLERMACLNGLLQNVLKFNLEFTFAFFLNAKILNPSSSSLIKLILKSNQENLIKSFLSHVDRNTRVNGIGTDYDGNLCHAIYWNRSLWLFEEFLKYDDVNWDALDSKGFTVLAYMIHESKFDERFRMFLTSTKYFKKCSEDRNILDECLVVENPRLGLSKFVTYLADRKTCDDFGDLLVSAALHNRLDYFNRVLEYRYFNCCHELNVAFQTLFNYLKLGETYLYDYLFRILESVKEWHGERGNKLEHVFLMKWEIQLGNWKAAADEMGII